MTTREITRYLLSIFTAAKKKVKIEFVYELQNLYSAEMRIAVEVALTFYSQENTILHLKNGRLDTN